MFWGEAREPRLDLGRGTAMCCDDLWWCDTLRRPTDISIHDLEIQVYPGPGLYYRPFPKVQ